MNLTDDSKLIISVLLQDGWHDVADQSFESDAANGFSFKERINKLLGRYFGNVVTKGPISSIRAVRKIAA